MTAAPSRDQYRRRRLRDLEQRCAFLEAERSRLERLLGAALIVGARDRMEPLELLELLAVVTGENLAGAALYSDESVPEGAAA
jgi:hypothetical protein